MCTILDRKVRLESLLDCIPVFQGFDMNWSKMNPLRSNQLWPVSLAVNGAKELAVEVEEASWVQQTEDYCHW